ncbi:MAG: hypothetical protein L6V95_06915 [Candidatus Melainabacteria bacterium]|nr:MAG: hypothetical protein L6V95_06915 [Candidatus Melainabacteria bacterium]
MSVNLKAKDGTISDMKTHNEIISRHITSYLVLILITSLIVSLGSLFFYNWRHYHVYLFGFLLFKALL